MSWSESAVTANGVTTRVARRGSGRPVVLIHGFPLSRKLWARLEAPAGWEFIAPDLRGMGEAQVPDTGYSMAGYARDLLALADGLGLDRPVWAGLSMGGYVLFEVLRQAPDRVAGVILMDTKAEADDEAGRAGRDTMAASVAEEGSEVAVRAMLPKLLAEGTFATRPEVVEEARAMMRATPAAGVIGALQAMRDRPDSRPLLPEIAVPALVVVGEEDRITPPALALEMAARIPGSRLETIPGAGHLPPMEQPARTGAVVDRFLGRV